MKRYCRRCDAVTEWVKVEDYKVEKQNRKNTIIMCEKCLENYDPSNFLTLGLTLEEYAEGCIYQGELYTCPICGLTRPADKKYFWTDKNGNTSIICDKCIDSKKKKWSPGCLIFLLCLAGLITYIYLIYY
jgi:hypothetical protein